MSDSFTAGKILAFSSSGTPLFSFAGGVAGAALYLGMNYTTGEILGAGLLSNQIKVYSPSGALLNSFGTGGATPRAVAVDSGKGMIYVTASGLSRYFSPSQWTDAGTNVFANAHAGAYTPPLDNVNVSPTVELGINEVNNGLGLKAGQNLHVTGILSVDVGSDALKLNGGSVTVGQTANFQSNKIVLNSGNLGSTLQINAPGSNPGGGRSFQCH